MTAKPQPHAKPIRFMGQQFASEEERAENVNIGMSVEKGNTQLRDAINTVVSALTPDQFNILMEQAIAVQPVI